MLAGAGCATCVMHIQRDAGGKARGEVGIDERKPFGFKTSTSLCWGRSEGCRQGMQSRGKYLHGEQRRANELWQQQGGFRLWQWEKLSEAFQKSEDRKEVAFVGVCVQNLIVSVLSDKKMGKSQKNQAESMCTGSALHSTPMLISDHHGHQILATKYITDISSRS